jgi:cytochrome d ubiquinol oxidase subunit I
VIEGVLPTALGVSSTGAGNVLFSLIGFVLFYSALLVVDLYLLVKYVRLGPDEVLAPGLPMVRAAAEGGP